MKPRQVVLIVMLLLAAAFAGVQIYYQVMTQRLLGIAMQTARDYPNRAFWTLLPVRKYGDFWTWGESSKAVRTLTLELYNNSVTQLFGPEIQPRAYSNSGNTLQVMRELQRQGYPGIEFYMSSILKAARDSVPKLEEDGSYPSWLAMMTFYQSLATEEGGRGILSTGIFPDYAEWTAHLATLDKRIRYEVVYFRDVMRTIAGDNRNVREMLGFDVSRVVAGTVLPLGKDLSEPVCRDVYGAIEHGIALINEFERVSGGSHERDVQATIGFLKYNEAALMVAHLQDLGSGARRLGSSLIARIAVSIPRESIPPPTQLVDEYLALIQQNITDADNAYERAQIPEGDRAGLLALDRRLEMEMMTLDNNTTGPMELARAEMQQSLSKAEAAYHEAVQAAPGRPVFLLRIPGDKTF